MIDVAREAKVGKGTLYEYFASKQDLFSALVVTTMRDFIETVSRKTVSADPERAMRDTIDFSIQVALVENLDLYRLFYDFWGVSPATRRTTRERLRETVSVFREFVTTMVRRGQASGVFRPEVDAMQFAYALSAAIDGLSLQLIILGDHIDLREYSAQLQQVLLGGLTSPGALGGASILKEEGNEN